MPDQRRSNDFTPIFVLLLVIGGLLVLKGVLLVILFEKL